MSIKANTDDFEDEKLIGTVVCTTLSTTERLFAHEMLKRSGVDAPRVSYAQSFGSTGDKREDVKLARALLDRPEVRDYIKQISEELLSRERVNAGRIVHELAALAFSDISEVAEIVNSETASGESIQNIIVKDFKQMPESTRRAIQSISITQGQYGSNVSIKFHSKTAALNKLVEIYQLDGNMNKLIQMASTMGFTPQQDGSGKLTFIPQGQLAEGGYG